MDERINSFAEGMRVVMDRLGWNAAQWAERCGIGRADIDAYLSEGRIPDEADARTLAAAIPDDRRELRRTLEWAYETNRGLGVGAARDGGPGRNWAPPPK